MSTKGKFSGLALVNAVLCSGGNFEADKNGLNPVMLVSVAGIIPNRNVLSGTVAANLGIVPGKTYLVQCTETEPDEKYGRRFRYNKLSEPTMMEIVQSQQVLGTGSLFRVEDANVEEETPEESAKQIEKTTKEKQAKA